MVACSQPLAAGVGLEILRKGGNAGKHSPPDQGLIPQMNCDYALTADAAVAVSAALNVTEPSSCGLGGYVCVIRVRSARKHTI